MLCCPRIFTSAEMRQWSSVLGTRAGLQNTIRACRSTLHSVSTPQPQTTSPKHQVARVAAAAVGGCVLCCGNATASREMGAVSSLAWLQLPHSSERLATFLFGASPVGAHALGRAGEAGALRRHHHQRAFFRACQPGICSPCHSSHRAPGGPH